VILKIDALLIFDQVDYPLSQDIQAIISQIDGQSQVEHIFLLIIHSLVIKSRGALALVGDLRLRLTGYLYSGRDPNWLVLLTAAR
jgi:hypothetical protein